MSAEEIQNQGSREMPEFVRRGLVRVKSGNLYLRAAYRVLWMREEHPDWAIVTSVEHADYQAGYIVFKAVILDAEGRVLSTAHAEERRERVPMVEAAETAAISRALGLCGYGTEFGEFDEGDLPTNGDGAAPPPATGAGPINTGKEQCPSCFALPGKAHLKTCKLAKSA